MDLSLSSVLKYAAEYGPYGLLLFMWWTDMRALRVQQERHSEEFRKTMSRYASDMADMRHMYENNAELVRHYESLAKDLKDVIIVNAQAFQRLEDSIRHNQFCPMVRLEKQAYGDQR